MNESQATELIEIFRGIGVIITLPVVTWTVIGFHWLYEWYERRQRRGDPA